MQFDHDIGPKTMVVSRKENRPSLQISVDGKILQQVGSLKYLGQIITDDGKCETEIGKRIEIARQCFIHMKEVLTKAKIGSKKKNDELLCLSTFLYASEASTTSKEMWNKIESFEM